MEGTTITFPATVVGHHHHHNGSIEYFLYTTGYQIATSIL